MPPAFDQAALLDRVDNDFSFLGETVEMLSSDGRALMADIRRAIADGDAAAVGRSAHALKGMISNFGATAAQESALEVERIGKSGDMQSTPAAVETLEHNLDALIVELQQFLHERT